MAKLTYAQAKQYAQDRLQDSGDIKATRQGKRVVKNALRRIARSTSWEWYRRRLRLILRAPVTYSSGLDISALTSLLTPASGGVTAFSALLSGTSFYFSGESEMHRVAQIVSASALLFHSTEPWVGASVGAAQSNQPGKFVYDRIALPENFRALVTEPQQRSYLCGLQEVSLGDLQALKRQWQNTPSDPIYYSLVYDQTRDRWELWLWPPPNSLNTADLIIDVWPEEPVNDTDTLDWDPQFEDLLYAAMDLEACIELEKRREYPAVETMFRRKLKETKAAALKSRAGGPVDAGPGRRYPGSKISRSDHFIDVP